MRSGVSSSSSGESSLGGIAPSSSRFAGSSLSAFEAEIVAVFADLVGLLGLPKSMGEIYGFVFASAEPPTFADIEQKLGLSKGSVSQGLRALKALGAVKEDGKDEAGNLKPEKVQPLSSDQVSDSESQVSGLRSQPSATAGLQSQPSAKSQPSGGAGNNAGTIQPRATRWVATTELRQLIGTLLRERLTPYLERQDQRMEAAENALEAQSGFLPAADYKALKHRLSKLQTWQSRARTVLPVLGKML